MARPIKCRRVDSFPGADYFKPAGIPLRDLEEVGLSIEEVEAIRLKDLEGLDQEQGAEKMNVSRPTFQRILSSARQKIADAILNGKAMRIEGGNYEMAPRRFKCGNEHEWDVPYEIAINDPPRICPACNSTDIAAVNPVRKSCGRPGNGSCCRRQNPDSIN
jgi:predicted DNA-binding protein (UPF0251 family)